MLTTTEGEATPILIVRDAWLLDLGRKPYREVWELQKALLRTGADFGIDATREGPERGVWVSGKKIASIGLAVHRNVTFHGFALNVTTDLREFLKIRPCGHDGGIMTSMEKSLGHPVDLEDVKASVIAHFQAVFGVTFRRVNLSELLPELPSGHRSRRP